MRELASCLGEYAVQVSDTSCSSYTINSCITPRLTPSIQNSVTCLYRTILSNHNPMTIAVTWTRTAASQSQSLAVTFDDDPAAVVKINTNSRYFHKSKGTKSLQLRSSKIELLWDLSAARYQPGPEPLDGFYLLVIVDDSELALHLGDRSREPSRKLTSAAKFTLVSRREHFSGNSLYSTKAQFSDSGSAHEISIRCSGENEGMKHPILSVCIDKKMVIRVKKLQWNFRGNQTIFLDGLLVDLMWDVHDWFYKPDSNYAVFMFRTRSESDTRLWLHDEHDRVDFSFMIYACKNMRTDAHKFMKNDVELGQALETLQKQPEKCMHNVVSLDKKGWREGLFCGKIFRTALDDRCGFHAESRFFHVQIPITDITPPHKL